MLYSKEYMKLMLLFYTENIILAVLKLALKRDYARYLLIRPWVQSPSNVVGEMSPQLSISGSQMWSNLKVIEFA